MTRTKIVYDPQTQLFVEQPIIDLSDLTATPEWQARMLLQTGRVMDTRVEVIDAYDTWLADVPAAAQVECDGDDGEQFAGSLALVGPDWYPASDDDLLHPLAHNRIRVWWQEWLPELGGWGEVLLGTFYPNDPSAKTTPRDGASWSLQLDDVIAEAKRGGYGGQTIDVGGFTVDAALNDLFDVVAPNLPRDIPESTTILPTVYSLGSGRAEDDWTVIAALDGMIVRSTREGVITCYAKPEPADVKVDWQEGAGCVVAEIQTDTKTSTICNAVVVKSSSSAVVPVITATKMDTEDGSPTNVAVYGPYWADTIESDAVATQDAADTLAATKLAELLRPQVGASLKVPPRPDLDPGDLAALAALDIGLSGEHRVGSWSISCPQAGVDPDLMSVAIGAWAAPVKLAARAQKAAERANRTIRSTTGSVVSVSGGVAVLDVGISTVRAVVPSSLSVTAGASVRVRQENTPLVESVL